MLEATPHTSHESHLRLIRTNLFEKADKAREENAGRIIPVFSTESQTGRLVSLRDYQALRTQTQPEQQTLSILRGGASILIQKENHEEELILSEGDMTVIPPGQEVSFYDTREGFLGYSISSPATRAEQTGNVGKLFRHNLRLAYDRGHWEPFMSTHGSGEETDTPSEVFEVDLFHPGMEERLYDLNDSQAARLLILNQPTVLDRHTHPVAQHHLYIEQGKAKVEHEGTYHILRKGDIFVVQTGARHALGAEEASESDPTLVVVVNSPGIPSTGDHYSEPA